MYRLTLIHIIACMVRSAIVQAIGFLNWIWLINHRFGDRWLLGNHGWLLHFGIVVVFVAIHSVRVRSHGLQACALFSLFVWSLRCVI